MGYDPDHGHGRFVCALLFNPAFGLMLALLLFHRPSSVFSISTITIPIIHSYTPALFLCLSTNLFVFSIAITPISRNWTSWHKSTKPTKTHRYLFHYICEDGLTYMCMADDSFGRRIPFAFLQDIKEKFLTQYGRERALNSLVPYGMNEFSKTIAKQMVRYFTCNASINAYPHTRSFGFF